MRACVCVCVCDTPVAAERAAAQPGACFGASAAAAAGCFARPTQPSSPHPTPAQPRPPRSGPFGSHVLEKALAELGRRGGAAREQQEFEAVEGVRRCCCGRCSLHCPARLLPARRQPPAARTAHLLPAAAGFSLQPAAWNISRKSVVRKAVATRCCADSSDSSAAPPPMPACRPPAPQGEPAAFCRRGGGVDSAAGEACGLVSGAGRACAAAQAAGRQPLQHARPPALH